MRLSRVACVIGSSPLSAQVVRGGVEPATDPKDWSDDISDRHAAVTPPDNKSVTQSGWSDSNRHARAPNDQPAAGARRARRYPAPRSFAFFRQ